MSPEILTLSHVALEDICKRYMAAGYDPIPLHKPDYIDSRGRERGKSPLHNDWPRQPSCSLEELAANIKQGHNIGIRLRDEDLVIDYDPRNDEDGSGWDAFVMEVGQEWIDSCMRVNTGGGGQHYYATKPAGLRIQQHVKAFGPGVEFKTKGSQVVAPGSKHPNGSMYELGSPLTEVPEAPELLLELIGRATRDPSTQSEPGQIDIDRLARLLQAPDPEGLSYEQWTEMGMASYHATNGQGLGAFLDWSLRDPEYAGHEESISDHWDSWAVEPGEEAVTMATLLMRVREAGGETNWLAIDDLSDDVEEVTAGIKPLIRTSNRQQGDVAKELIRALTKANRPEKMFRQGGHVVIIHPDDAAPRRQTAERFRAAACDAAEYVKTNRAGEESASKLTQDDIAVALEWLTTTAALPILRGITSNPIMRDDGSILCEQGFDAATGLYADLGDRSLTVPEHPSAADIASAKALCLELIQDFPFADNDASRAHALAIPLTLIMREAIDGPVPATAIDAPAAGTGKSLLARTLVAPVKGKLPSAMPELSGNEEEVRKRITSVLRESKDFAFIDNLEHPLHSSTLAMLLTEREWSDRKLGQSEMVTYTHRAVWCVTGNNVQIEGDLVRRFVWIRIDAEVEKPHQRPEEGFSHPLPGWALEHQDRLLSAMFTLCRAWIQAGRPKPTGVATFGSFEAWTHVVGGILEVAGIPGFLDNSDDLWDEMDQEGPQWGAFLTALRAEFGDSTFLASDVKALDVPVPDGLPDLFDSKFNRALGKALRSKADRRFSGLRIVRAGTGIGGAVKWMIRVG